MTLVEEKINVDAFTLNDIHVGSRLYEALVTHAQATQGASVFYSSLLDMARKLYPQDAELARAVPVGIGNKLLFVQAFCDANGYPNLACLAVSMARRRPGAGYKGDWERDKQAVAQFDWTIAKPSLETYVAAARAAVTPMKRRTDEEARATLWEHFKRNHGDYATFSQVDKEEMVNLLMEGLAEDTAFKRVLAAKVDVGAAE